MNIQKVATALQDFMADQGKYLAIANVHSERGINHLSDMLRAVESGRITGEKAHRWLGYIQGVIVHAGGKLEDMKQINRQEQWPLEQGVGVVTKRPAKSKTRNLSTNPCLPSVGGPTNSGGGIMKTGNLDYSDNYTKLASEGQDVQDLAFDPNGFLVSPTDVTSISRDALLVTLVHRVLELEHQMEKSGTIEAADD